jgi:hypothetical protein
MASSPSDAPSDDGLPAEIAFSKRVLGKFYRTDAQFDLSVYLDHDIQT